VFVLLCSAGILPVSNSPSSVSCGSIPTRRLLCSSPRSHPTWPEPYRGRCWRWRRGQCAPAVLAEPLDPPGCLQGRKEGASEQPRVTESVSGLLVHSLSWLLPRLDESRTRTREEGERDRSMQSAALRSWERGTGLQSELASVAGDGESERGRRGEVEKNGDETKAQIRPLLVFPLLNTTTALLSPSFPLFRRAALMLMYTLRSLLHFFTILRH
jgi:hypothetical protein